MEGTNVPVNDPEDLHRLFAERANAGDLQGLLALYEDGAAFVAPRRRGCGRQRCHP